MCTMEFSIQIPSHLSIYFGLRRKATDLEPVSSTFELSGTDPDSFVDVDEAGSPARLLSVWRNPIAEDTASTHCSEE